MIQIKRLAANSAYLYTKIKRMHLHHIAIWTNSLEEQKEFYVKYFNGTSNQKYVNPVKGFESYFVSFDRGSGGIEIMRKKEITASNPLAGNSIGLAHFSFATGSKEAVLELTERLRKDGYTVASEPRTTGDGYFESAILDGDGNCIEITL